MFDPPTGEQQVVLDLVAGNYLKHGRWPAWAYLEEELDRRDINGAAAVQSFGRDARVGYSPLWPRRVPSPAPGDQVGLTIAGLIHVERAKLLVTEFVNLVDALGTCRDNIRLDPFANERPKAIRGTVLNGRITSIVRGPLVIPLLSKEPATWNCLFNPLSEDWETVELSPEIRRFAGVQSAEDYLERLHLSLLHETLPSESFFSPFTLPASIDYLDVVWHLRFGEPLVTPPGVERSARLAFTAASAEEADTRFSALAELLKGLRVPGVAGVGGHPLQRLGPFLEQALPAESHGRIRDAIAILDAARQIRAGAQHAGARSRSVECYAALGIGYPVYDWPSAWQTVQIIAAHAFDSIRDEIQAN
jgi:hypothetical protein